MGTWANFVALPVLESIFVILVMVAQSIMIYHILFWKNFLLFFPRKLILMAALNKINFINVL